MIEFLSCFYIVIGYSTFGEYALYSICDITASQIKYACIKSKSNIVRYILLRVYNAISARRDNGDLPSIRRITLPTVEVSISIHIRMMSF